MTELERLLLCVLWRMLSAFGRGWEAGIKMSLAKVVFGVFFLVVTRLIDLGVFDIPLRITELVLHFTRTLKAII